MENSIFLLILIKTLFFGTITFAQLVTGHHGTGLSGLHSAGGFPTGWFYVDMTHFYYAGEYKDNDGKVSTFAKPVNVIANISAGIWGTNLDSINAKFNAAIENAITWNASAIGTYEFYSKQMDGGITPGSAIIV